MRDEEGVSVAEQDGEWLFAALPVVDATASARLYDRLVAAAEQDGILDVGYRTIDTPVGELLLAATGAGLLRVAYLPGGTGPETVLSGLARQVSPRILHAPRRLDRAARQLDDYFARRRTAIDVPLDLRLADGFARTVLTHLPAIPYGQTASYAQTAAALGRPGAARAVGAACARNPLPVVLPCHRVVRSDGTLAGYIGGLDAKRHLLALEASR